MEYNQYFSWKLQNDDVSAQIIAWFDAVSLYITTFAFLFPLFEVCLFLSFFSFKSYFYLFVNNILQ